MTKKNRDTTIEDWEQPIGRFVVAFAGLETWMHVFVHAFGSEHLHGETVEFQLAPRIKLLRGLLRTAPISPEALAVAELLLKKLAKLSETRNLIVHNGIMVDIYQRDDGDMFFRHSLRSARSPGKQITLPEIVKKADEAKRLGLEFADLWNRLKRDWPGVAAPG